jgi:hypothetical protein
MSKLTVHGCCASCGDAGDLWGPLILCLLLARSEGNGINRVIARMMPQLRFDSCPLSCLRCLVVCVCSLHHCSTLSLSASGPQAALIFAAVFVLVWAGAGVITLNAALLGGNVSTLQSVCVLGYCLAPLNVASILCHAWGNPVYHLLLVALAFVWSTRASVGFMAQLLQESRRALGVYPVLLFYAAISWMILVQ